MPDLLAPDTDSIDCDWVIPLLERQGPEVLLRLDSTCDQSLDYSSLTQSVAGPVEFHTPTDPWWPKDYILCLSENARLMGQAFTTALTIGGRLVGLYGALGIVRLPGGTDNPDNPPRALTLDQAQSLQHILQTYGVLGTDQQRFQS